MIAVDGDGRKLTFFFLHPSALRSVGRNGFPAPHLPQINFLVDYIGVLKNQVSRAAKAPAATIAGSTTATTTLSIEGSEGGDDLLGQAVRVFFMK